MPAYRSEDEAEIRAAVVDRLRVIRPKARIMHEVNVSSYGNRVDVLAVDLAEIVAVEIKSKKDKIDRLPEQIRAMKGCAHHVIAALHEKFFIEQATNKFSAEREENGQYFMTVEPPEARGATVWRFPERDRALITGLADWRWRWNPPTPALATALPWDGLDMLWRDELARLCDALRVSRSRRSTMTHMVRDLRWHASGAEITKGVCAALRARRCVEADPAVEWSLVA